MAIDFNKFNIETKNNSILNIKDLCDYIKSVNITSSDISYLESLANKLSNDDNSENLYSNEYSLVNALHEVILKYYIEHDNYDGKLVFETLKVYNKNINNIDLKNIDNHDYIIFDESNDLRILYVDSIDKIVKVSLNNLSNVVCANENDFFNIFSKVINELKFYESNNEEIKRIETDFNLNSKIYECNINGIYFYKIKNGLLIKNNDLINTIKEPDMNDENKVVDYSKYRGYKNKDNGIVNDFNYLRKKVDLTNDEEERFFHDTSYLINTMTRRYKNDESDNFESNSLKEYMDSLINNYYNDRELSENELGLVSRYLDNLDKIKKLKLSLNERKK